MWCDNRDKPSSWTNSPTDYYKQRGQNRAQPGTLWIKNVKIVVGLGGEADENPPTGNIVVVDGKITDIGPNAAPSSQTGVKVIDGKGAYATPGIVDMHEHCGVYSFPDDLTATSDGNEMTDPITVYVRALDAFDAEDFAIRGIRSGGITTGMVIPGSGNVMGGEGLMIKLVDAQVVSEMLISDASRLVKMACGENPKRVYGDKGEMPMSRMGIAWLMRKWWFRAAKAMRDQSKFCATLEPTTDHYKNHIDLEVEPLIGILKGLVRLHIHCYQTNDIEMVIRLGEEFGFNVTAVHHALEAYLIADMLKAKGVSVATFSDLWGYKWEAYDASVYQPRILQEKKINVALKSDHPVIYARDMMYEGGKSHYYGSSKKDAFASLYINPARATGTDFRVGSLEKGKDADIVLWESHPLQVGSLPTTVMIEGKTLHEGKQSSPEDLAKYDSPTQAKLVDTNKACKPFTGMVGGMPLPYPNTNSTTLGTYVVDGVKIATMDKSMTDMPTTTGSIYVKDGMIEKIGTVSGVPDGTPRFTITGGIAMPGLIEASSIVGISDVGAEKDTRDGHTTTSMANMVNVTTLPGVRLRGKHQVVTLHSGVTTIIPRTPGYGVLGGLQSAFGIYGDVLRAKLHNIKGRAIGLEVTIGNTAKGDGIDGSISGQIASLEQFLTEQKDNYPVADVLSGKMPLIVNVNQADEIVGVVDMKKRILAATKTTKMRVVVVGGAEAHLIVDILKANDIAVILSPPRCRPDGFWETARCNPLAPGVLKDLDQIGIAYEGLETEDNDNPRNLRWEAGYAVALGLPYMKALRGVTSTIADIYGLKESGRIQEGNPADFVVYSGNPLSFNGRPLFIGVSDRILCDPHMY
eukprot:TRINITY_DN58252_c0_g1_i1.p1 TRINITY_DN58252_c0_g1~~TRINITY_DN58252_c0_g1_i1.p1  ORF type:complete len:960 (-),score=114.32 TRINITY_DN58252_c0_g1_i1:93-2672(-)